MIVKTDRLKTLLKRLGWDNRRFAESLGIDISEAEKMLTGLPVGQHTARRFIYWLKAVNAQHYIDWDALGITNPLLKDSDEDDEPGDGDIDNEDEDYEYVECDDEDDPEIIDYGTYYDEENWDEAYGNAFDLGRNFCKRNFDGKNECGEDDDAYLYQHKEDNY